MECGFCELIAARDAEPFFEDEHSFAILDHRPVFPGHALLIPKLHVETLADAPDSLLGPLMGNARLLARAMETGLGAEGSFIAINNRVSQSVPHLHIHIVPRRKKDGLRGFFWPRQRYRDAAHEAETRESLRRAIAEIRRGESGHSSPS